MAINKSAEMKNKSTFCKIFGRERFATISLRFISKCIWHNRKIIIKWELIGILIGLIICFSIPKEYVSTIKMAPEKKSTQVISFTNGISFQNFVNSDKDAYTYRLYPLILDSNLFLYDLLSVSVPLSNKYNSDTYTIRELLGKKYKHPWWHVIMKPFQDYDKEKGSWYNPSETDYRLMERLRNNISLIVMDRTGHLELQVKMQDAMAAAVLADTIAVRIGRLIGDYRESKNIQRYEYAEQMYKDSKVLYEIANQKYAQYLDSNHNLTKNSDKIKLSRLKIDKDICSENYRINSLMFLSEEFKQSIYSPVYYIFEPSTVAVKASYPRKLVILSYCMFFFGYIPILKSLFKRA